MVIAYRNGAPVTLNSVANIFDGVEGLEAGGMDE